MSNKIRQENGVYKINCEFCNKEFSSLSKKQVEFNYTSHVGPCKSKFKKEEKNE
jgi:hypothetical protein